MFADCLAGKHEKRIKICQKTIDALNKALAVVAKNEKYYLDLAARSREKARKLESCCQDKTNNKQILKLLQEEWTFLEMANDIAEIGRPAREELLFWERLQEKEIEALQHEALTTARQTKPSCFFFWH